MAANYDNSAWFYDRLSRVVYGRALIRSQVYLLRYIPAEESFNSWRWNRVDTGGNSQNTSVRI